MQPDNVTLCIYQKENEKMEPKGKKNGEGVGENEKRKRETIVG